MQLGRRRLIFKKHLNHYLARYKKQPYRLGHHDCFLFCLRWADLQNSTNLKTLYNYNGTNGAADILKDRGVTNAFDFFDRHFIRTSNPKEGDLVGWSEGIHGGCGIVTSDQFATVQSSGGYSLTDEKYYIAWSLNE